METVPARGLLTNWLVALLRPPLADHDPEIGLGDGIAPEKYGWPQGQPGVGTFKPYGVVKTLQGGPQRNAQPMSGSNAASWTFPYQLTGWGAMRPQADMVCDAMNAAVCAVPLETLRGPESPVPGWQIQQIVITPLGTTDRTDQAAPSMWSRTDVCTIWLARAQAGRRG